MSATSTRSNAHEPTSPAPTNRRLHGPDPAIVAQPGDGFVAAGDGLDAGTRRSGAPRWRRRKAPGRGSRAPGRPEPPGRCRPSRGPSRSLPRNGRCANTGGAGRRSRLAGRERIPARPGAWLRFPWGGARSRRRRDCRRSSPPGPAGVALRGIPPGRVRRPSRPRLRWKPGPARPARFRRLWRPGTPRCSLATVFPPRRTSKDPSDVFQSAEVGAFGEAVGQDRVPRTRDAATSNRGRPRRGWRGRGRADVARNCANAPRMSARSR
jgi:hypothetical protein